MQSTEEIRLHPMTRTWGPPGIGSRLVVPGEASASDVTCGAPKDRHVTHGTAVSLESDGDEGTTREARAAVRRKARERWARGHNGEILSCGSDCYCLS